MVNPPSTPGLAGAHEFPTTPAPKGGRVRVIPLGGLDEIGENMMVVEYEGPGSAAGGDIVIIDMGLMFPTEDMPGIDFVIPDTTYLQKNKHRIRGAIITHGHLDHTGAIPYVLERLGNPPIYAMPLTIGLIKQRLEEFNLDRFARLHALKSTDEVLHLGSLKITFFRINHSIPDGVGVAIHTPLGALVFTADFKFDFTPVDGRPAEFDKIAALGTAGVLAGFSDSTNVEKPGHTPSEREVGETFQRLFSKATGRIIVTTFASSISRVQLVLEAALAHNRKIAVSGRSMEQNLEVALRLGYLHAPRSAFVKLEQIRNAPDNRVCILSTGGQGQESSALSRMSRGEHRVVKIKAGDTVVLSSSPVPGNEKAVQTLMNNLSKLGARVVYNKLIDVHVSGHAFQEDLKLMLSLMRPKFFIPIHGDHLKLSLHAELATTVGVDEKNIFVLSNGQIVEFTREGGRIAKERLPGNYVLVDGLGIGDIGEVVLRERQHMAADGMFVIITTVDHKTGKLVTPPEIISRGFVYAHSASDLLTEAKRRVEQLFASAKPSENWVPMKDQIRDEIGQFLFGKTQRRPLVLPVVIEV
jgi:ribonuclease J